MYHVTKQDLNRRTLTEPKTIGGIQIDCTCQKGKRHKKAHSLPQQPSKQADRDREVEFIDIDDCYNFEARIGTDVIAELFHDADNPEKGCWVVAVGGVELHRSHLWADSRDWVQLQYERGTLPPHVATAQTVLVTPSVEVAPQVEELVPPHVEELLDKPFDELTVEEWEQLRGVEPVKEQILFPLTPSVVCHKCDGHGCGYCGYRGLTTEKSPEVYEMDGVQPAKYRFVLSEYTPTSTIATLAYWCFDGDKKLGLVFRQRNCRCSWENRRETFYWACGDGHQYSSALDVANALTNQLVGV